MESKLGVVFDWSFIYFVVFGDFGFEFCFEEVVKLWLWVGGGLFKSF